MRNRTIKIAVAEVLDGGTKSEFYADLQESLDTARRAANKSASVCFGSDTELMTGGKCPKLYTYPIVLSEFPGVANQACTICRDVERKYRRERWEIRSGRRSLSEYRSFPWPLLRNKSHRTLVITDQGEFLTARIRLLGGGWKVRLAGGTSYRDQTRGLREAIQNSAIRDSKIWVDRKHKAILGVSVELPDVVGKGLSGTLEVCTGRDSLIVATKQRNEVPFVITGDEVKHWISERQRRYQRLSQDRKSGVTRAKITKLQRSVGDKWKRRMTTYIGQTAAKIVAHAKRRKVATVRIDMTIKSFIDQFPWYQLASAIEYRCEDAGIEFVNATQTVSQPDTSKPHVYFKLAPTTNRVKIGRTGRKDGGRHRAETDSPEELTILAIDNQPKTKLAQREKHFHALFADHRMKGEWFDADPIVHWLREAKWLGNAGNRTQIAQVLPVD